MSEWMPIESAPKDGGNIILWLPFLHGGRAREGFWRKHDQRWGFLGSHGVRHEKECQPTYWQHLPEPPVQS